MLIMVLGFVVFLEIQNKRVAHERDRAQLEQDKAEQVSDFLVQLLTVTATGSVTITEMFAVHPLASCTVQMYVPAASPVNVGLVK